MIQESINQLLTTVGVAARFSPLYESSLEGRAITKRAKQAQRGFSEIAGNLENPEKSYTKTELDDIKNRVREHNRDIYTAKTAALTNPYVRTSGLQKQPVYSADLRRIEESLEKRYQALENMKSKGEAALTQQREFKNHKANVKRDQFSDIWQGGA